MDKVFERVIEIENSAKELYKEAVIERERLLKETLLEIKDKGSEIQLMADEKIEQLITQSRKDVEVRINNINSSVKEKLLLMEEKYTKKAEEWEQQIFFNVIGE